MIRRIIFLAFIAVALVGCDKQSIINSEILDSENQLSFTAYANILSKGGVINSTDDLKTAAHFKVGVFEANSQDVYIPFSSLDYDTDNGVWRYYDEYGEILKYYWPVAKNLTFAAHYPTGDVNHNFGYENYYYSESDANPGYFVFNYTVNHDVDSQDDVLYALREDQSYVDPVNLHFKHALTQIDFMAKLDEDLADEGINITVYGVEVHNVRYTGDFYVYDNTSENATTNTEWKYAAYNSESTEIQEYDSENILISEFSAPVTTTIIDSDDYTTITTGTGFMLMPQEINAWNPSEVNSDITKTGVYLAISCQINQTKSDGSEITIHHKENYIYVPLTTTADYGDSTGAVSEWRAGYKITYRLLFGGGYSTEPGSTYPVTTLTPMTITTDVDGWTEVDAGEILGF